MEVDEVLDQFNLSYRRRGHDELCVQDCPFCGDHKGHFFINQETGLWNCKKCDRVGNLWTLRRELGQVDPVKSVSEMLGAQISDVTVGEDQIQQYIRNLEEDSFVVNWLLGRGLTRDTIQRFRLGVIEEKMIKWLTIPLYLDGVAVNVKFRSLPPADKQFRVLSDHLTPLFNIDALDTKKDVFITEGEIDAMTLIQEGYENVVSLPLGAGTFQSEHFDALVVCNRINLVLDNDVAGRKGTTTIADRLGAERCYRVMLPVNDINDFFQAYHRSDFVALVDEAEPVGRSSVLSIGEAFVELEEARAWREVHEDEITFPWGNVNYVVGALEPGWLVVLQAIPKVGKTTLCLNVCHHLAKKGLPAMIFCLEMNPRRLLERVIASVRPSATITTLTDHDIVMAKADLLRAPLYFGTARSANLSPQGVFETIRYATRRFGLRLVVFDHLHFLCRSLEHTTAETGQVMRDFKLLFEELKIPGIVIVHPRKMDPSKMPDMYSARSSGEIPGDCDVMISLFRRMLQSNRISDEDFEDGDTPTFESRTLVQVTASRFSKGGRAVLFFDGDSMRFTEVQV